MTSVFWFLNGCIVGCVGIQTLGYFLNRRALKQMRKRHALETEALANVFQDIRRAVANEIARVNHDRQEFRQ